MKTIYYLVLAFTFISIAACGGADYNPEYKDGVYNPDYKDGVYTLESNNIEVADFSGNVENRFISTTVQINNTPENISSLIIELEYDPAVLQYYTLENAGVFMQGYGFGMEVTHTSATGKSTIIFEFYTIDDALYLPAGSSGLISKINFKVLKNTKTTVKILETEFDDTYPGWTKKDGLFSVLTN